MPDDVVEFLENIFDKPMHTWVKDPGYAGRVVGMCPPPSNSDILVSANRDAPLNIWLHHLTFGLLSFQGPVPKFDPAFMLQALLAYSPHKAATGQVMTKWDHNVRTWMENVMATAYGVAPVLAFQLDDIATPYPYIMEKNAKGKLVPKLDSRDMPIVNPNYDDELFEFGKLMAPKFDELKSRQAFGRRAAHGFNITFELLRRARNINFANEVCWKKGGGVLYITLYLT